MKKTVILGLGNTILTDDGAGIYVARKIDEKLKRKSKKEKIRERGSRITDYGSQVTSYKSQITILEASLGGFNFIDLLAGYNRAVIVDAIHTKSGKPGEFYELDPSALRPSARLSSLHGIDFATACKMAGDMNVPFPSEIKIFVIEAEDEFTFGERCTPAIEISIPQMADFIIKELISCKWLPA